MSRATTPADAELPDRIEAQTERLLRSADEGSDGALSTTAAELWDVVAEAEDLLGTVDLERLPDAVDVSALPDLLERDELPDAIREGDPDAMLDLNALRRAVELRELWNAVDLIGFRKEAREFVAELEDVVGPDVLESAGDSETATELEAFVDEVKADATNAAIQQRAKRGIEGARSGIFDAHSAIEESYVANRHGSGYVGRRPASRNPTAVSTVPHGPLPAGVSARVSTVPSNVRGARIDALPRVYARRWRAAGKSR